MRNIGVRVRELVRVGSVIRCSGLILFRLYVVHHVNLSYRSISASFDFSSDPTGVCMNRFYSITGTN